jgi:hypothetical protein
MEGCLNAGASIDEIMETLKIGVIDGESNGSSLNITTIKVRFIYLTAIFMLIFILCLSFT